MQHSTCLTPGRQNEKKRLGDNDVDVFLTQRKLHTGHRPLFLKTSVTRHLRRRDLVRGR